MAGLPKSFDVLSPVIANYDFVDIASGTGYINFYAGNTVDKRLLSNFMYYSDYLEIDTASGNSGGAWVKVFDHDYDIILNRPLDLNGVAIVNIPMVLQRMGNTATARVYATLTLRKWDGVSETDISTNNSKEYNVTLNPAGTNDVFMTATDLDIPLTHFKKDETLRLTIELYAKTTGTTQVYFVGYAHDPMNRTSNWGDGSVPSRMMMQLPVRLNL